MSDGIVDIKSVSPPAALLADFGFDDDKLKPHHKEWLNDAVVASVRAAALSASDGYWDIRLEGAASQVGSDAYNMQLSKRRAQQVEVYLRGRLPGQPLRFTITPRGESVPVDPSVKDNDLDRAVAVIALKIRSKKPKPRRRRPFIAIPKYTPVPKTKTFEIAVVDGEAESIFSIPLPAGAGKKIAKKIAKAIGTSAKFVEDFIKRLPLPDARFGLLSIQAEIEIRDTLRRESASYSIDATAPFASAGLSDAPTSFSISPGKPTRFTDARSVDADDFGGDVFLSFATEKISFGKKKTGKGFRHVKKQLEFKWSPKYVSFGDLGQVVELVLN